MWLVGPKRSDQAVNVARETETWAALVFLSGRPFEHPLDRGEYSVFSTQYTLPDLGDAQKSTL